MSIKPIVTAREDRSSPLVLLGQVLPGKVGKQSVTMPIKAVPKRKQKHQPSSLTKFGLLLLPM